MPLDYRLMFYINFRLRVRVTLSTPSTNEDAHFQLNYITFKSQNIENFFFEVRRPIFKFKGLQVT